MTRATAVDRQPPLCQNDSRPPMTDFAQLADFLKPSQLRHLAYFWQTLGGFPKNTHGSYVHPVLLALDLILAMTTHWQWRTRVGARHRRLGIDCVFVEINKLENGNLDAKTIAAMQVRRNRLGTCVS